MAYKVLFFMCLVLFVPFLFCSKDAVGPTSDDFRYPLKTGNRWNYDHRLTLTFDVASGVRPPELSKSTIQVIAMGEETIFDSLKAIKLQEQVMAGETMRTSYQFYQNKSDALYRVAGRGEETVLPKRSAQSAHNVPVFYTTCLPGLHPVTTDSLHLEKPAKVALRYPLKPGEEWKYSERNKPRRINKRVVGKTDVQTNAGTFKTVKVQWLVDFDGDGEFDDNIEYFDYIANEGLVKRSFLIRGLPVVDDNGTSIGRYDYHDLSVLSSLNLK